MYFRTRSTTTRDRNQIFFFSGRRLLWNLWNFLRWIFFFSGFSVSFGKEITPKMWRELPDFRAEKKA